MFHKVKAVNALPDYRLSVQFAEVVTKIYDIKPLFEKWAPFKALESAPELGDVYLKRLEKAALRKEPFLGLSYNAMLEFTELVKRSREEKSSLSYVDACKEYIEKNLRKNLQVGDIAPAIGLSRTYLSRLFHQAEGITVQQYIQKERCRHAAQMLQYSDYSISQIAQYFGFSSQSYFGSCFQTWYGITPNAYRKANH